MASYGKQSGKWYAKIRLTGHKHVFEGGFRTKKDAQDWAGPIEGRMRNRHAMAGLGPETSLAVALRDYAYAVTVHQAGCVQVVSRINKYMRAAKLPILRVTKKKGGRVFARDEDGNELHEKFHVEEPLFELTEVVEAPSVFQNGRQSGFAAREEKNEARNSASQKIRESFARLPTSKLAGFHFHELMKTMQASGYKNATVRQELAILSGFFEHAKNVWNWPVADNPLKSIDWPTGDARERILTPDEAPRLAKALAKSQSRQFQMFILFALETVMRKGEALETACWCDIDYSEKILKLPHAKSGRREVPLTSLALQILEEMPQGKPTERIFSLTDAALYSCWKRVCHDASIVDLHIHDLRHTGITMYADFFDGDIFILQQITGHRTLQMLRRYVNRPVSQVSRMLDSKQHVSIARAVKNGITQAKVEQEREHDVHGRPVTVVNQAENMPVQVHSIPASLSSQVTDLSSFRESRKQAEKLRAAGGLN